MAQDHFRKVCTPNYVNVFRDRGGVIGVVEFDTPEDLARAIRKLDDTEFRNPFERAYVRVYDDSDAKKGGGGRGRSRSRWPTCTRATYLCFPALARHACVGTCPVHQD